MATLWQYCILNNITMFHRFQLHKVSLKRTLFFSRLLMNFTEINISRLIKCWVHVEEIGHKRQIQFIVALDDIIWLYEGTALNLLCFLQHPFCSVMQI